MGKTLHLWRLRGTWFIVQYLFWQSYWWAFPMSAEEAIEIHNVITGAVSQALDEVADQLE